MRNVIFSKRASKKLDKLLEYLESKWSIKVKKDFITQLDNSIEQIKRFPQSSEQSSLKKGLHRLVITRQTTIYYLFDTETIKVVTIFDNRMNPIKLKTEI